jgi:hypothetical protein
MPIYRFTYSNGESEIMLMEDETVEAALNTRCGSGAHLVMCEPYPQKLSLWKRFKKLFARKDFPPPLKGL